MNAPRDGIDRSVDELGGGRATTDDADSSVVTERMLGLDYSSSDDDEEVREDESEGENRKGKSTASPVKIEAKNEAPKATISLPSASAAFAGGGGAKESTGMKRPAPAPLMNPRQGQHKNPNSIGKVNTLLPPQLRGRSNVVTQDLEALGFRKKTPTKK